MLCEQSDDNEDHYAPIRRQVWSTIASKTSWGKTMWVRELDFVTELTIHDNVDAFELERILARKVWARYNLISDENCVRILLSVEGQNKFVPAIVIKPELEELKQIRSHFPTLESEDARNLRYLCDLLAVPCTPENVHIRKPNRSSTEFVARFGKSKAYTSDTVQQFMNLPAVLTMTFSPEHLYISFAGHSDNRYSLFQQLKRETEYGRKRSHHSLDDTTGNRALKRQRVN